MEFTKVLLIYNLRYMPFLVFEYHQQSIISIYNKKTSC